MRHRAAHRAFEAVAVARRSPFVPVRRRTAACGRHGVSVRLERPLY
jgi:hypothetical protein